MTAVTPDLTLLLTGLAVGLPLAVWPGPVLHRTIRSVPEFGVRAGIRAGGGHVLVDLAMIAILGTLALTQVEFFLGVRTALGVIAAGALGALGFRLMDRRVAGTLARESDRIVATVANPFWHLFWWTAGLRLIVFSAGRGATGVSFFAVGYLLPGLLWPTFVAARLVRGDRDAALADRQYRILTSLSGLALVAVGFWLGSEALSGSGVRAALTRAVAAVFGGGAQ
jgi:threonine/homoserine/homoserine lactone efflux protein